MRRNLAVTGGRQVKNEDFTQYIQSFTLLEGLFSTLSHGDFIFTGVEFTPNASNFDISAGIIYYDGELCIFDGATNVPLPYKLTKNRVGVNPREFQDAATKNTAEDVKMQFDAAGPFSLTQDTPRATNKFLRTVNGLLRAPIDGNNNGYDNVWKGILSDSVEMVRQIPKPTGVNRYLKIGEFPISDTQVAHLAVSGLEPNAGAMAHLTIKRTNLAPTDDAIGNITYIYGESNGKSERPVYYLKRNDGTSKYELWVKSPASIPSGDLTSGIVRLLAEDFTDAEDSFVFESSFLWTASVPTSIVAFSQEHLTKDSGFLTFDNFAPEVISVVINDVRQKGAEVHIFVRITNADISSGIICDFPDGISVPTKDLFGFAVGRGGSSGQILETFIDVSTRQLRFNSTGNNGSWYIKFDYSV